MYSNRKTLVYHTQYAVIKAYSTPPLAIFTSVIVYLPEKTTHTHICIFLTLDISTEINLRRLFPYALQEKEKQPTFSS